MSVLITVDTEGHRGLDPVDHLIWGKLQDGQEWGIRRIMDICDEYGVKATFFVDLAGAREFGEAAYEDICRTIESRGHDVQLHVHPDHFGDRSRRFLWQYSREEQESIIGWCAGLYARILARQPLAFRAGAYGANPDTLDVLRALHVPVDFSMYYMQRTCHLNNPPLTRNRPVFVDGILEVPVTIFRGLKLGRLNRYEKCDINSASLGELKRIGHTAQALGLDALVIFMHSFSFVKRNHNDTVFRPNRSAERKFRVLLASLTQNPRLRFLTATEYYNERQGDAGVAFGSDAIPEERNQLRAFWNTFVRAIPPARRGSRRPLAFVVASAGGFLLAIAAAALLAIWWVNHK